MRVCRSSLHCRPSRTRGDRFRAVEFQRKQIAYAEQHQVSRRHMCWNEFLTGAREERAEHALKRDLRRNRRRRYDDIRSGNC